MLFSTTSSEQIKAGHVVTLQIETRWWHTPFHRSTIKKASTHICGNSVVTCTHLWYQLRHKRTSSNYPNKWWIVRKVISDQITWFCGVTSDFCWSLLLSAIHLSPQGQITFSFLQAKAKSFVFTCKITSKFSCHKYNDPGLNTRNNQKLIIVIIHFSGKQQN